MGGRKDDWIYRATKKEVARKSRIDGAEHKIDRKIGESKQKDLKELPKRKRPGSVEKNKGKINKKVETQNRVFAYYDSDFQVSSINLNFLMD